MGAAQSREVEEEPLESGVRITKGLLDQLSGRQPSPALRLPPQISGSGMLQLKKPPQPREEEAEVAQLVRQDRSLAAALERSRRVGSMLLKAEDEELQKVGQLAEELLAREYQAPRRPLPCQEQAAECLRCYQEHESDTLSCAAAVRAYSECAQQAWAAAMQENAAA